jgi:hypothetical protein
MNTEFGLEKPAVYVDLRELGVDERIILNWNLKKCGLRMWPRLICLISVCLLGTW